MAHSGHPHSPLPDAPGSGGGDAAAVSTDTGTADTEPSALPGDHRGGFTTLWSGLTAVVGAGMGLMPHVLHHVSFFAGAALVTGVGGNLAFGALGLLFSIPLLRRLHRRFRTWKAPAAALAVFSVMFSLSAFVIGPAISGDDPAPAPGQRISPDEHAEHHD